MRDEARFEIVLRRQFESSDRISVTPSDVETLCADVRRETDAVMLGAILASTDSYWQGVADAVLRTAHFQERAPALGAAFEDMYEERVSKISFASPFTIETVLSVPASLAKQARRVISVIFERLYLPAEVKAGRQIQNAEGVERVRGLQLGNLERVIDIADRLPEEVRAQVLHHIGTQLIPSSRLSLGETVAWRALQVSEARIVTSGEASDKAVANPEPRRGSPLAAAPPRRTTPARRAAPRRTTKRTR